MYFHPASLFPPSILRSADKFTPSITTLSTQHPSEKHDPRILPSRAYCQLFTMLLFPKNKRFLIPDITSSQAVNRDELTNYVRIPYQICVKQAQCCQLACHKIATYRAPPCLMLGGIPPASLSEGWIMDTGRWNISKWTIKIGLTCVVNTMDGDVPKQLAYESQHVINILQNINIYLSIFCRTSNSMTLFLILIFSDPVSGIDITVWLCIFNENKDVVSCSKPCLISNINLDDCKIKFASKLYYDCRIPLYGGQIFHTYSKLAPKSRPWRWNIGKY